jgi:hypothetical protein
MAKPATASTEEKVSRLDEKAEGSHVHTASDGRKYVISEELLRDPLIKAQIKLSKRQYPDLPSPYKK